MPCISNAASCIIRSQCLPIHIRAVSPCQAHYQACDHLGRYFVRC
ncbi:hypothetical protein ZHAWSFBX_CDS_0011 [Agrobacterium phage Alfirin]|nr:hypothetical protein ZHAWSFBX_CDS_0011 [Agrobacterium phage Alfirin]